MPKETVKPIQMTPVGGTKKTRRSQSKGILPN